MTNTSNTSKKPRRISFTLLIVSAVCFFFGIFIFVILALIMGAIAPFKNAVLAIVMVFLVFLSFDIAFLGFIGMVVCGVIELINLSKKPQGKPAAAPADNTTVSPPGVETQTEPDLPTGTYAATETNEEPKAFSESASVAPGGKKPKKKLPVQLVIVMVLMGLQGLFGMAWVILWNIGLFSQMSFHTGLTDMPFYMPAMFILIVAMTICGFGQFACGIWLAIAHFSRKK